MLLYENDLPEALHIRFLCRKPLLQINQALFIFGKHQLPVFRSAASFWLDWKASLSA
jgi:hypothetical protein